MKIVQQQCVQKSSSDPNFLNLVRGGNQIDILLLLTCERYKQVLFDPRHPEVQFDHKNKTLIRFTPTGEKELRNSGQSCVILPSQRKKASLCTYTVLKKKTKKTRNCYNAQGPFQFKRSSYLLFFFLKIKRSDELKTIRFC